MAGGFAEPDEVRDGVWSVPQWLPAQTSLIYSFSYAFEDSAGAVHLVDTGFNTDENLAAIETGLVAHGHSFADVATVTATHLHPDHLGLADRIRTLTGAPVAIGRIEQRAIDELEVGEDLEAAARGWGVPAERMSEVEQVAIAREKSTAFVADLLLDPGDTLPIPGRALTAVATPGHTDGHLSFVDDDLQLVLTGDQVLPVIYPGLGLGSRLQVDPIGDYLAGLDRIKVYDAYEVAPGHFYRFRGLAERCDDIAAHHLRRTAEVEAVLARTPDAPTWEIASQLTWTAGWPNLKGFMLFSALMQTNMHVAYLANGGAA
ncbi:MAG: fold metallo-hydrolase [Microbacteriaceae bacterium]|nr:fold metallo-hydrolase [Microbacteriaceae bacterium]